MQQSTFNFSMFFVHMATQAILDMENYISSSQFKTFTFKVQLADCKFLAMQNLTELLDEPLAESLNTVNCWLNCKQI